MGTSITTPGKARCPLCGSPVRSVARGGRIVVIEARAIQLGNEFGRGYTLCDVCGILADLPLHSTLN